MLDNYSVCILGKNNFMPHTVATSCKIRLQSHNGDYKLTTILLIFPFLSMQACMIVN